MADQPKPSPAVPERAETPQCTGPFTDARDCPVHKHLPAPIDWESRCRQVEAERDEWRNLCTTSEVGRLRASLATVTAELTEARKDTDAACEQRDTAIREAEALRQELTEARSARERAEQASETVEHQPTLENVKGHWFIQGGEAQFGSIREASNPDEIISAILRLVRVQPRETPKTSQASNLNKIGALFTPAERDALAALVPVLRALHRRYRQHEVVTDDDDLLRLADDLDTLSAPIIVRPQRA